MSSKRPWNPRAGHTCGVGDLGYIRMSDFHYDAARTGLLLVDPYNDFLSEGGKLSPMVKEVAGNVGLLDNLRAVVRSVRQAGKNIQ